MSKALLEESEREYVLLQKFARFRLTQASAPHGEQGKVANQMGISQAHLSNIIHGHVGISDPLLRRLAAEWGWTREQFVSEAQVWAARKLEAERPQRKTTRKAS